MKIDKFLEESILAGVFWLVIILLIGLFAGTETPIDLGTASGIMIPVGIIKAIFILGISSPSSILAHYVLLGVIILNIVNPIISDLIKKSLRDKEKQPPQ